MASKKIKNLVVKVGEYKDRNNETKFQWQTIGALFEGDKGQFIILEKWFNPAGVKTDGNGLLVSLYDPGGRDSQEEPARANNSKASAPTHQAPRSMPDDFDDDVAF